MIRVQKKYTKDVFSRKIFLLLHNNFKTKHL